MTMEAMFEKTSLPPTGLPRQAFAPTFILAKYWAHSGPKRRSHFTRTIARAVLVPLRGIQLTYHFFSGARLGQSLPLRLAVPVHEAFTSTRVVAALPIFGMLISRI